MKLSILFSSVLTVISLSGTTAQAQAQPSRGARMAPKPRLAATGVGLKDGLTMQKGRVVLTELGITNPLQTNKKLLNGTTISPAGAVTAPDGTTSQMSEGDLVSLTGRLTTRSAMMESDSLAKIKLFDALHPGKRKKMEDEAERKEKAKTKREEEKAKAKGRKKR